MSRRITFMQAINEGLDISMNRDDRVFIMGEDLAGGTGIEHLNGEGAFGGVFGVTKGLVEKHGYSELLIRRFLKWGIWEQLLEQQQLDYAQFQN